MVTIALGRARRRLRKLSAPCRLRPVFLVIGAQKSGTTSLHRHLCQHPQLAPPVYKELNFFDSGLTRAVDNFAKGERWYRSYFPLRAFAGGRRHGFETSSTYLFHPRAPARIAHTLGRVKLVAVLRNPAERAISHYFHEKRRGREPLGLMTALKQEEARLTAVLRNTDYKHPAFTRYAYKQRGRYHEHLSRYLEIFPRRDLLVVKSERLFTAPQEVLAEIFDFLGLCDHAVNISTCAYNAADNRIAVHPGIRRYLYRYFEPYNQKLYDLLGSDFDWN